MTSAFVPYPAANMSDPLLAAYEAIPYGSKPITTTFIPSLEAVAVLHGLSPTPSSRCRVLELGCASAGNIIPMAERFSESEFVGIDLAPSQIAEGQRTVDALGLANVTLRAMSVTDVGADFGSFDYIICHGVYSWVPPDVQEAILRVCSANLAANGVAYVSYNTYPGWHARGMARDMILYHDDPSLPATERVARARHLIDTLAGARGSAPSVHQLALAEEAAVLRTQDDAHFAHEQLEPYNAPVYFAEFARRAGMVGLRYVSDAKLTSSASNRLPWLESIVGADLEHADVIRVQQYIDFARGRTFRRSILCHDALHPHAAPRADAIGRLHFSMRAEPVAPPADTPRVSSGTVGAFRSPDGVTLTTNNPVVLGALTMLHSHAPASLSFEGLVGRITARLEAEADPGVSNDPIDVRGALPDALLQCAIGGLVGVCACDTPLSASVSRMPRASGAARLKAMESADMPNLRHYTVTLSDFERFVLIHLDGSRSAEQLVDAATEAVASGALQVGEASPTRVELASVVHTALTRLAAHALLEA